MKKIISIMIIILLLALFTFSVFADYDPAQVSGKIVEINDLNNTGSNIVKIFQVIGSFSAVAILAYVGIKFMMAGPGEKAQLKGALVPYVVGAIVIFAAVVISTILQNIAGKIT